MGRRSQATTALLQLSADAKNATKEDIRQMITDGEFVAFHNIEDLFEQAK